MDGYDTREEREIDFPRDYPADDADDYDGGDEPFGLEGR